MHKSEHKSINFTAGIPLTNAASSAFWLDQNQNDKSEISTFAPKFLVEKGN